MAVSRREHRSRKASVASRALGAALVLGIGAGLAACSAGPQPEAKPAFRLVVHGGAGTIRRENMSAEREAEYRAKMEEAIQAGYEILDEGGSALDAVVASTQILEDSPLFNAGRGAVFTHEGTNELDASIMDGRDRDAGAVAGVTRVRSPIALARAVMEHSPHVLLAREGAEVFAEEQGHEMVDPEYFYTERRWRALERAREAERTDELAWTRDGTELPDEWKIGTVGAAALDRDGNLAAATTTGGMTNKRFGRIGDSPIIGAGTFADNRSCAVSATGHGEFFIRNVVAYDICARMHYTGATLQEAADAVVHGVLVEQGATGGVVAVDKDGNIALPFNTPGMYRGHVGPNGEIVVEIYGDEG